MKVIVLGGGGAIGRRAASILAESPAVDRIVIADSNPQAASDAAARLGDIAEAVWADMSDPVDARNAMSGCDVAVGCLGARPALEIPTIEAAIDSGVPYVGNCDNWNETQDALELNVDAEEAGAFSVVGVGASPGLTNLMAIHAADEFERVSEVHIAWVGSTNSPSNAATLAHTFRSFAGRIPVYERGAWHFAAAGTERRRVWFPEPVGGIDVVSCGHPEPLTLPRYIDGVERVTVSGSIGIAFFQDALRLASDLGMSRRNAERLGGLPGVETWLPGAGLLGGGPRWSGVRVEVRGDSGGVPKTVVMGAIDSMQNLAGGPLAIAGLMVGSGEVSGRGVVAPEAVLDPKQVFAALAKLGIKIARLEPADGLAA